MANQPLNQKNRDPKEDAKIEGLKGKITANQKAGTSFDVPLSWSVSGDTMPLSQGSFLATVFFETMGPEENLEFGPHTVAVNSGNPAAPEMTEYSTSIPIEGGLESGVYNVVALITHVDDSGAPRPVAGFVELGAIEVTA